jgi:hypothetical protein
MSFYSRQSNASGEFSVKIHDENQVLAAGRFFFHFFVFFYIRGLNFDEVDDDRATSNYVFILMFHCDFLCTIHLLTKLP